MRTSRDSFQAWMACTVALVGFFTLPAHAQYTGDNQTNTISGVTSNWVGNGTYVVGSNFVFDALLIQNGGVLSNGTGYVGYTTGGNSNIAIVSGSGSAWINSGGTLDGRMNFAFHGSANSLIVSNGGKLVSPFGGVVGNFGSNNTVLITGSGSVWSNGSLSVGSVGAFNRLVISNGGRVLCATGAMGLNGGNNNTVVVTGSGSIWSNSTAGQLYVGVTGSSNSLVISDGAKVFNNYGQVGGSSSINRNNSALVTGTGSVWDNRTNLYVGFTGLANSLTISNGGKIVAGNLLVNAGNSINFIGGTLEVAGTTIQPGANGGAALSVGDGVASATFHLLGGVHTFNDGLRIRSNSFLTGCGTINGTVIVDAGGSVVADCGGDLTFTGSLTNNGILHAENGSVLESYGSVVNNGIIDLMDGTTNFHSTFINNGTIVNASDFRVTSITQEGNNMRLSWPTVGGRRYVVQVADHLAVGFADLGSAISIPGTSLTTTNYLDLGGATNAPSRFYRVWLVP